VRVTEQRIEIAQKLFFAFGTTKLLPKSEPLLDEVAQALKDRPSLCVRVEGHTDSKGSRDQNFVLSEGRAAAVRDYLLVEGIDAPRLTSKGYADTLPIDSNGTVEGRENNRRVEFVIVGCP
jgi:outer membrane protein OmpA-like peptidoglycan-associated protein